MISGINIKMITAPTFKFLKDLKKNNNRPWFEENRGRYLLAKEEFEKFIASLLLKMIKFMGTRKRGATQGSPGN